MCWNLCNNFHFDVENFEMANFEQLYWLVDNLKRQN